ncbi:hypothetical protein C8J57DRAFT_1243602 [Mycena rebaudengoi]|nr:hypothetical protein C8J57DRAFT_1243602 [Mycena rebaudengoi]
MQRVRKNALKKTEGLRESESVGDLCGTNAESRERARVIRTGTRVKVADSRIDCDDLGTSGGEYDCLCAGNECGKREELRLSSAQHGNDGMEARRGWSVGAKPDTNDQRICPSGATHAVVDVGLVEADDFTWQRLKIKMHLIRIGSLPRLATFAH